MHTNIVSTFVLLGSVLTLGGVATLSNAFGQAFDITTEQGDESAVITVKLATNNTVVIPPNGTVIEVPGNVTQIDNDTVIIAPENETITEVPGNVTVISPPEPEPCGCPEVPPPVETAPPIEPVLVAPAPGQEVITTNGTELIANESQEEPIPIPPEQLPTTGNETVETPPVGNLTIEGPGIEAENVTITDDGDTAAEAGNNDTALSPAASFAKMLPWWEA